MSGDGISRRRQRPMAINGPVYANGDERATTQSNRGRLLTATHGAAALDDGSSSRGGRTAVANQGLWGSNYPYMSADSSVNNTTAALQATAGRHNLFHPYNTPGPHRRDGNDSYNATGPLVLRDYSGDAPWSAEEIAASRRLVKFQPLTGNQLFCAAVIAPQCQATELVICCIYNQDDKKMYITSADVLHLLGHVMRQELITELKGKARRSMEVARPNTVRECVFYMSFFVCSSATKHVHSNILKC